MHAVTRTDKLTHGLVLPCPVLSCLGMTLYLLRDVRSVGAVTVHASLGGLAEASPDLFVVHVLPHLPLRSLAALAVVSKACLCVATHDSHWMLRFHANKSWQLEPVPVAGEVLAARLTAAALAEYHDVGGLSVRALMAELKGRGISAAGLLEKQELRDALSQARAADLPTSPERGRLSGWWQQAYRGARAAEALRATHVLMRPMRGRLGRQVLAARTQTSAASLRPRSGERAQAHICPRPQCPAAAMHHHAGVLAIEWRRLWRRRSLHWLPQALYQRERRLGVWVDTALAGGARRLLLLSHLAGCSALHRLHTAEGCVCRGLLVPRAAYAESCVCRPSATLLHTTPVRSGGCDRATCSLRGRRVELFERSSKAR